MTKKPLPSKIIAVKDENPESSEEISRLKD